VKFEQENAENREKQTNSGLNKTNLVPSQRAETEINGKRRLQTKPKTEKLRIKNEITFEVARASLPGRQGNERWCFTVPIEAEGVQDALFNLQNNNDSVQRLVVGEEQGGEIGYRHYQGFVQFSHRKSMTSVKQIISDQAHLEKATGTFQQNYEYCTKEHRVRFEKNGDAYRFSTTSRSENEREERAKQIIKDAETMEPKEFKTKWRTECMHRRSSTEK
jgi:hypothetical protein